MARGAQPREGFRELLLVAPPTGSAGGPGCAGPLARRPRCEPARVVRTAGFLSSTARYRPGNPIASISCSTPPGSLRVDKDQVTLEIEVRPSNPDVRSVSIAPEFDEKKLRVQQADGGQPLRPGRPVSLQVEPDRVARLRLQINTAVGLAEEVEGGQYPIELRVQGGAQMVPYTIQCAVPKPNEVDLIVERIEPLERARRFGRNGTELRPLVNRSTYFRLLLANLSGQDKQVAVELYRIPNSDWAPGRLVDEYGEPFVDLRGWLFQTGTDRLLPGVEPVAKTAQPVSLPADARPREVDLSPRPHRRPSRPRALRRPQARRRRPSQRRPQNRRVPKSHTAWPA